MKIERRIFRGSPLRPKTRAAQNDKPGISGMGAV